MSNARIFLHLLHRDMKILKKRLFSIFLDNILMLLANVALFGYLLPKMGMANELIGPLFIGYVVMSLFEIGFGLAIKIVNDIKFGRFIDYQITLPISANWILFEYVTFFVIKACIVTLPLLLGGILLLGNKFAIIQTNWFAFAITYFLMLVFFSTLFLFFSFAYEYNWFNYNIWSRRLEPLFLFGGVFVVWKKLFAFSKILGIIFLFNPVTYVAEGIRSTLIGGNQFLPASICIIGILIGIIINWLLLVPAMQKKLDLVQEVS